MFTLCLVAAGLSITTLALAFRRVGEGYEDEGGFHSASGTNPDVDLR